MKQFIRHGLQGCASVFFLAALAAPASAQFVGGGFGTPGPLIPGVQFNYLQTVKNSNETLFYHLYPPPFV